MLVSNHQSLTLCVHTRVCKLCITMDRLRFLSSAELPTPAPLIYSDGSDPHESADYKVRLFVREGIDSQCCSVKTMTEYTVNWEGLFETMIGIKYYNSSLNMLPKPKAPQRFGFHLWLTEITVRLRFHSLSRTPNYTQDPSVDSLEALMRGNVDITVASMTPPLLAWCCTTCFWSGFSKTANTS